MPKKGKKKPNPRTPSAKPKKSKKVAKPKKVPKPKASRNPKQTTRRIPAQVGARSRANITEVVAPDGSRGGVGSYNPRRTPEEIRAEREAQARLTLGINDFPIRQTQRTPAPRRVQEPVGGFTGLTSGYGITPNKEKLLNAKITDMEARLTAEINKQNQPNNVNQAPEEVPRLNPNIKTDADGRIIGLTLRGGARPAPTAEVETQTINPARTREKNKRSEEKRLQDIRDELDRQTKAVEEERKQAEAQSTISRILKDANDKVKDKKQKEAEEEKRVQDIRDELDRQTKAVEEERKQKEDEVRAPDGFIRPTKKPDEIISEFDERNKSKSIFGTEARQQQLIGEIQQKEQSKIVDDIMGGEKEKEIQLTAEPLQVEEVVEEVDSDDDFKSVDGFDEIDFTDETTQAFNQARELYDRKQREKQNDRSNITQPTSQRERPQEQDPQNLLNVSSLRKDIKDSFGQSSLEILRKEQAEREKKQEETRREKAERERLRKRPLPERPLPVPPNLRTSTARADVGEIIDDVVDIAFDTATENAKRLEKERKEKQRKDREEERKRIASEATQSLIGAGIRGAVDTQQRRDRGGARAERDRGRRTATGDVSEIVDNLVDRSIVQAQSKETQVRSSGQGRRGTDIEGEVRKFRSNLLTDPRGGVKSFEDEVERYRNRLEARQSIQDEKNRTLGALMNFGVNGQFIPFNARDLIRITNSAKDRDSLSRLRDLIRNDRREEVRRLENEIMDLAIELINLKKKEKDESNKIAKLRKR